MGFILARRILKAHPNGFVGAIVEGKRSIGKSSYCIKVMKEVYQTVHSCDDKEAYEYSLANIIFTMDDIIETLRKSRKTRVMIPVLTWDDAGVGGSSMQWFLNMRGVQSLKAIMDTVRTATTGLLLNCPDREGLTKMLRGYDDYLVTISVLDGWYKRSARGYNVYKLPSGMRRIYRSFDDRYSCYLPKWVYDKYMLQRNSYLDDALKAVEDMKHKMEWKGKRKKVDAVVNV